MFWHNHNPHNYSNRKSHSLVELGDGSSPASKQQKALLLQHYSREQGSPLVKDLVKHSRQKAPSQNKEVLNIFKLTNSRTVQLER